MPIIKYDYIVSPHITNKKLIAIYSPIISIQLSSNHKIYPFPIDCLIDSGADFNLLPARIGESLGLSIKKGDKVTHMGIGSIGITAYSHPVKIYLGNYSFKTTVDFSYNHKIPLLGRYGFFRYFKKVTFHEKELRLELNY